MNKQELVAAMAAESGMTKADSEKALNAVVNAISGALKGGDSIQLIGFGTFKVSERAARTGINPLTKKPLKIAAKKVAQFKAGKALSELVNCRNIDCYALGGSYESADMVYKICLAITGNIKRKSLVTM